VLPAVANDLLLLLCLHQVHTAMTICCMHPVLLILTFCYMFLLPAFFLQMLLTAVLGLARSSWLARGQETQAC
jgi:hypothetical protein